MDARSTRRSTTCDVRKKFGNGAGGSHVLGYSSVEVTLNTYAHFYEEDVFKAMDNLSDHYDRFTE